MNQAEAMQAITADYAAKVMEIYGPKAFVVIDVKGLTMQSLGAVVDHLKPTDEDAQIGYYSDNRAYVAARIKGEGYELDTFSE